MKFENLTDEELVILSQQGNNDATTTLLYRYKDKVKGFCRGFFIVGAEIDDLIQEGMIGLYNAIQTYKTSSVSFKTYAFACIRNKIKDAIKFANRKKNLFLNEAISIYQTIEKEDENSFSSMDFLASNTLNPEEQLISNEFANVVLNDIKSNFSDLEFKILLLFLQGKTYDSIANDLSISTKKVDNSLAKIRRYLKKFLLEHSN